MVQAGDHDMDPVGGEAKVSHPTRGGGAGDDTSRDPLQGRFLGIEIRPDVVGGEPGLVAKRVMDQRDQAPAKGVGDVGLGQRG